MINSENTPIYTSTESDEIILQKANAISLKRLAKGTNITSSDSAQNSIKTLLQNETVEIFGYLLLDSQHGIIKHIFKFNGTINSCAVYPREVVKDCLTYGAAAIMFFHNHPSGALEPSQADIQITQRLKTALETVDIRTLDHFIVSPNGFVSFANRGLL